MVRRVAELSPRPKYELVGDVTLGSVRNGRDEAAPADGLLNTVRASRNEVRRIERFPHWTAVIARRLLF